MQMQRQENHQAPKRTNPNLNARDFIGGKYLKVEDMRGDIVVTIDYVDERVLQGENTLVVSFAEIRKSLTLNATNINTLSKMFGSDFPVNWQGKITLYVDPNVYKSGVQTGGIRIKPASVQVQQQAPVEAPQAETPQPQAVLETVEQPPANAYANGSAVQPTPQFRQ